MWQSPLTFATALCKPESGEISEVSAIEAQSERANLQAGILLTGRDALGAKQASARCSLGLWRRRDLLGAPNGLRDGLLDLLRSLLG